MSWQLSEACLLVEARRLSRRARATPLVAALAVCAWLGACVLALRAGTTAAHALEPMLADVRVARVVVLTLALSASAAGATLGLTAPGLAALGGSLAAAPVSPCAALSAVASARLAAVTALGAPPLAAATVPVVVAGPGAVAAGCVLVAVLCACAVAGASVAELVLRLVRRTAVTRAAALPVGITASAAASCEAAAHGVAGSASAAVAAALGGVAALTVGARSWPGAALGRPVAISSRRRIARRSRILPVLGSAAVAVLTRAPDVRLAIVAGAGSALLGMGAASMVADADSGVLLAVGVAALAAGLAPLSAGGRIDVARWAWSAGTPWRVAVGWAGAGGLAMSAAVAPVVAVACLLGASIAALLQSAHVAVVVAAVALGAGALVPRRAAGLGDDAAALAAFVTVLTLVVAGSDAARSRLAAAGVPETVASVVWLALACTVAVDAVRRRVRYA